MSRNPYSEHDDRTFQGNNRRSMGRRKFNQRGGRGGFQGRLPMQRYRDDDVDMHYAGGSGDVRRFNPYNQQRQITSRQRKKNRLRGKGGYAMSAGDLENQWFKITVPYGKKEGKQFVLKTLLSNCKVPFVPFNFHFDGNAAVFYVEDHSTARALCDVSKRVTTTAGFKMSVFMNKAAAPVSTVDDETIKKIELGMNSRYDVTTHSLDLKRFHHDADLRRQGLYISLQRPNILTTILKIIKEHIPELEKLDVSENGLYSLQSFSILAPVCTQLTSLSLENNKLKTIRDLDFLKGLNICNVVLDGNPLCDDFRDKDSYIKALRDRFPKLMLLDGHELPVPIGFDLGTVTLPVSKGSFLTDSEAMKLLVIQFLEEYYVIYDSEDKAKLLDKYHDQANFSLSVVKPYAKHPNNRNTGLGVYMNDSRNLSRNNDPAYRFKLLRQGRLSVVSALSELPQTQHDPNSFVIDTSYVLPKALLFSVTGVFKEVAVNMGNQPLRTFHRMFLITMQAERWVISNDQLSIMDATAEQVKAFKCPAPTPSPSPAPSAGDKSPNEKQQIVAEFMKLSGMNLDFSAKCLDENEWDFPKAATVFRELNSVPGRIPPEAFITDKQQLAMDFVKISGMNLDFSAKCLEENEWNVQKALMVFQEINNLGRIPPEAFLTKS